MEKVKDKTQELADDLIDIVNAFGRLEGGGAQTINIIMSAMVNTIVNIYCQTVEGIDDVEAALNAIIVYLQNILENGHGQAKH